MKLASTVRHRNLWCRAEKPVTIYLLARIQQVPIETGREKDRCVTDSGAKKCSQLEVIQVVVAKLVPKSCLVVIVICPGFCEIDINQFPFPLNLQIMSGNHAYHSGVGVVIETVIYL